MSLAPVAVFCPLRSGSTMLRLMLDGHPQITCPDESDFLFDHRKYEDTDWRYDREALSSDRIFLRSKLPLPQKDGKDGLIEMMSGLSPDPEKKTIIVLHRHLESLVQEFPDARVIRLLRDPRDVAKSAISMGWAGNTYHGIREWERTQYSWDSAQKLLKTEPLTIRYEDLVAHPERELTKVCDFVDVQYSSEMLSYPERTNYDLPNPAMAFQWRRRLTPREVGWIEARVGETLQRDGYEPSGYEVTEPSTTKCIALALQNKFAVWRFMFNRYGLRLPIQRGLGRRLNLRKLKFSAQHEINEIDTQYLR